MDEYGTPPADFVRVARDAIDCIELACARVDYVLRLSASQCCPIVPRIEKPRAKGRPAS